MRLTASIASLRKKKEGAHLLEEENRGAALSLKQRIRP